MTSTTPDIGTENNGTDDTDLPTGPARGSTVINDAVVAKIAGLAVREVTGVYAVGGGAARALGAIREAISSADHSQGVSVKVIDARVAVDLSIVAEYPLPLQQVADEARTAIIDAIETLAGLEVTEVNVTINDVHLPDEAADSDEAALS